VYEGPIIDAHTHPMLGIDDQLIARPHPPELYRQSVAGSAIGRAAALVMAPRDDMEKTQARNDAVLKLAETSGQFFFPVCSVHPADGNDALAEIDRVSAAGCAWLKLHPVTQEFDVADPAVTAVVTRATERGRPLLFDAYSPWDADQPGKFINLALAVPEARLILAHAHGPSFPQLLIYDVLARYPWWRRRVWIDISATALMLAGGPFAEQFTWILRKVGTDRVVFGSDFPIDDPIQAANAVRELGFTDAELAAIMHDNAAALLEPDIPDSEPAGDL
jgi:predicted TIM-barrel fold metal-dependent hydrolase